MGAAAVPLVYDVPVGGKLVAAYPEHLAKRSRQRQEETTVATYAFGGSRHRRIGTVIPGVPSFGSLGPAPCAHHPAPAQPDFGGGLIDLRVTAGGVAGHQPRVIGRRCQ